MLPPCRRHAAGALETHSIHAIKVQWKLAGFFFCSFFRLYSPIRCDYRQKKKYIKLYVKKSTRMRIAYRKIALFIFVLFGCWKCLMMRGVNIGALRQPADILYNTHCMTFDIFGWALVLFSSSSYSPISVDWRWWWLVNDGGGLPSDFW